MCVGWETTFKMGFTISKLILKTLDGMFRWQMCFKLGAGERRSGLSPVAFSAIGQVTVDKWGISTENIKVA